MNQSQPIGIFDSGIGGLTVAKAVIRLLPNEKIIYFGDTAHLPYGDKSTAAIQSYAIKICNLLLSQNCKLIFIACNSASAAAYDLVKEYVGSKAHVMNVIDPVVNRVREEYGNKSIGLIGTKATVNSHVYQKKIDAVDKNITLKSLATPLLASMIEEGFFNNGVSQSVIHEYLSQKEIAGIEALILGCTHYPLIKKDIDAYYEGKMQIIDSSEIVAKAVSAWLDLNNLANKGPKPSENVFYVSDYTDSFRAATRYFFDEEVDLKHYPLWE